MVEWDGKPATDEGAAEVWCRVRQADEPGASRRVVSDAELVLVEYLGAVDNRFIYFRQIRRSSMRELGIASPILTHSLYSRRKRAQSNHGIHLPWLSPLVRQFSP